MCSIAMVCYDIVHAVIGNHSLGTLELEHPLWSSVGAEHLWNLSPFCNLLNWNTCVLCTSTNANATVLIRSSFFPAQNAPNLSWLLGSTQTHLGSLNTPLDSLEVARGKGGNKGTERWEEKKGRKIREAEAAQSQEFSKVMHVVIVEKLSMTDATKVELSICLVLKIIVIFMSER